MALPGTPIRVAPASLVPFQRFVCSDSGHAQPIVRLSRLDSPAATLLTLYRENLISTLCLCFPLTSRLAAGGFRTVPCTTFVSDPTVVHSFQQHRTYPFLSLSLRVEPVFSRHITLWPLVKSRPIVSCPFNSAVAVHNHIHCRYYRSLA